MKRVLKNIFKLVLALMVALVVAGAVALFVPVNYNLSEQSQYPNLPNGCESVSASVALSGKGLYVSAEDFAANYLPKADIGTSDPNEAYQGDPFGSGYYCYQNAMATGINNFLATQNTSVEAKTHSLVSFSEVLLRLHADGPVIVWGTVNDSTPYRNKTISWEGSDGNTYHPYENLHVMVIDGVQGGKIHLVDSISGARWVSAVKFIPIYYEMGLRAVFLTD